MSEARYLEMREAIIERLSEDFSVVVEEMNPADLERIALAVATSCLGVATAARQHIDERTNGRADRAAAAEMVMCRFGDMMKSIIASVKAGQAAPTDTSAPWGRLH